MVGQGRRPGALEVELIHAVGAQRELHERDVAGASLLERLDVLGRHAELDRVPQALQAALGDRGDRLELLGELPLIVAVALEVVGRELADPVQDGALLGKCHGSTPMMVITVRIAVAQKDATRTMRISQMRTRSQSKSRWVLIARAPRSAPAAGLPVRGTSRTSQRTPGRRRPDPRPLPRARSRSPGAPRPARDIAALCRRGSYNTEAPQLELLVVDYLPAASLGQFP